MPTNELVVAEPSVPNHHGEHRGFAGLTGLLAGISMIPGRGSTARFVAGAASAGADDVVVDIGCGPGTAAREAARRGAQVIAVDPAAVMLDLGRRLTRSAEIDWRQGAAESLPIEDSVATIVWSVSSVHHWPELDRGLEEVARVLRSGGRFLAVERSTTPGATGHASHGWTDSQAGDFARRCEARGFEEVRVRRDQVGRRQLVVVSAARR